MSNIIEYNGEQINLLKDTVCKGATDNEFKLFLYAASRTGLDPLAKQIYAVKRWNTKLGREEMTVQTSVDGFRVVAERSGKYAGQLGPFWCGEDGVWKDVWLSSELPAAAKLGVLRHDFKEPVWGIANFNAYAQRNKEGKLTQFWIKMPELMIAKVAECLALRKAFPQDLSNIYSPEEMAQAESEVKTVSAIKPIDEIKTEQIKRIVNHADSIVSGTQKTSEEEPSEPKPSPAWRPITRDEAELIKVEGNKYGYNTEAISRVIFAKTKKYKWAEIKNTEIDSIIEFMKENKKVVL
jgi:phage recombination protein Bet